MALYTCTHVNLHSVVCNTGIVNNAALYTHVNLHSTVCNTEIVNNAALYTHNFLLSSRYTLCNVVNVNNIPINYLSLSKTAGGFNIKLPAHFYTNKLAFVRCTVYYF